MQLKRPGSVIFSVDLECAWDSVRLSESCFVTRGCEPACPGLQLSGDRSPRLSHPSGSGSTQKPWLQGVLRLCVRVRCVVRIGDGWMAQLLAELAGRNRWCFCEEPSAPSQCASKDPQKTKGNLSLLFHLALKAASVNPSSSFRVVGVVGFSK